MTIKLSICIPTYNRSKFLGDTLANIADQCTNEVEIVIMDGASTDNTENVVQQFKERFDNFRYFCGNKNMGVDADLAQAVAYAQGEYCWLMSSDDLLIEGALSSVLNAIQSGSFDVLLGGRVDCTKEMLPMHDTKWINVPGQFQEFEFQSQADLIKYFDMVDTIGAVFSYIPCIIVSRKAWLSCEDGEKYFGTNYAHVYRILNILKQGKKLRYSNELLVMCRMDNDSFTSEGLVKRYLIDYVGYLMIANGLFPENKFAVSSLLRVITREHRWPRLIKLRAHCKNRNEWQTVRKVLMEYDYPTFLVTVCGVVGSLKPLIGAVLWLYPRFRRFLSN